MTDHEFHDAAQREAIRLAAQKLSHYGADDALWNDFRGDDQAAYQHLVEQFGAEDFDFAQTPRTHQQQQAIREAAERLAHYAACDEHEEDAPHVGDPGCPACGDRAAYQHLVDAFDLHAEVRVYDHELGDQRPERYYADRPVTMTRADAFDASPLTRQERQAVREAAERLADHAISCAACAERGDREADEAFAAAAFDYVGSRLDPQEACACDGDRNAYHELAEAFNGLPLTPGQRIGDRVVVDDNAPATRRQQQAARGAAMTLGHYACADHEHARGRTDRDCPPCADKSAFHKLAEAFEHRDTRQARGTSTAEREVLEAENHYGRSR